MKSICTINPAITENTESSIVKVHASFIDLKWVYLLIIVYYNDSFHFQLFNMLGDIPSKW